MFSIFNYGWNNNKKDPVPKSGCQYFFLKKYRLKRKNICPSQIKGKLFFLTIFNVSHLVFIKGIS